MPDKLQNLYIERELVKIIFMNNQVYEGVSEFLQPKHFSNDAYADFFDVMQKLIEKGEEVNQQSFSCLDDGCINGSEDDNIFCEIIMGEVSTQKAKEYGELIFDLGAVPDNEGVRLTV